MKIKTSYDFSSKKFRNYQYDLTIITTKNTYKTLVIASSYLVAISNLENKLGLKTAKIF